ncbi:MAG TPA: carboxypeptidase-like regulatory domain-containing protein [bacterium]|nr:carboxypeptidase-like regulatory domain-containing protein [bacterium]
MRKEFMRKLAGRKFFGALIAIGIFATVLGWNIFGVKGATYTWDNGGGDGLWSTCTNWTSNTCPGAFDIARFSPGTSDTSSTIDPAFAGSVNGILVEAGFTGTITQNRTLVIDSGGIEMYGGTLTGSADNITNAGSIYLENAVLTATSGTMTVNSIQLATGGTFNHNNGTVKFTPQFIGGFFATTAITFNNVEIAAQNNGVDIMASSGATTAIVLGSLTLTEGNIGADLTLDARGTITHTANFDGGLGTILVSAGAGDINAVSGGAFPAVTLSTARNLIMTAGTVTFDGAVTVEDGGTFDGSTGTTQISGSLVVSSGSTFGASTGTTFVGSTTTSFFETDAFTVAAGATFNPNGGTLEIGNRRNLTVDVDTSLTLENLNIDTFSGSYGVTITTGDTLVVAGQLLLDEGYVDGGTIEVQGTFSQQTTFGTFTSCGSTIIHVTAAITIAPPLSDSGSICFTGINLDNAGAIYDDTGAGNTAYFGGSIIITQGTFEATSATTYMAIDADFDLNGGTFHDNGGLFQFEGGTQYIYGGPTFTDLTILSDDITFESGTTLVVNGFFDMYNTASIMTVHSSTIGVQALIDFNGTTYSLYSLDVQDNQWVNASPASCVYQCTSSGNNTNWTFIKNIVVTDISGYTTEAGGTATFTVVLDQGPDANVTIGVSSSDTSEGTVSTALLTFTTLNWATPQTITVTGVDDLLDDEGVDYTIVLAAATSTDTAYSGVNARDISVRNLDNDNGADNVDFDFPTHYIEQTAAKTDLNGQVAQLTEDDFIATNQPIPLALGGTGDIVYNTADDSLWFAGDSGDIYEYVIDTDTLTSHASGGSSADNYYVTYDNEPTRSRVWMTHASDSEIVAFNNDGSVFGSFATNANPNRILFVNANDANAANDSIWLGNLDGTGIQSVTKYNAATGAPYITDLATSTFPLTDANLVNNVVTAITYDTNNDAIWITTNNDSGETVLVGLNQSTGAPLNGSLVNSTFVISPINPSEIEYDSANNYLWIMGDQTILAIDPETGNTLRIFENPGAADPDFINSGIMVDTVNNILIVNEIHGNIYRYDIADAYFTTTYASSVGGGDVVFDAENDIWVLEAEILEPDSFVGIGAFALEEVRYGVTQDNYYTVITDTGSVVDSSAWTDLTDTTVTETLDSGFIYYSLAFGTGSTYSVFTGGAWRDIASSSNAIHGGTDGVWYYRDNASSWTAASSNNAQTALSQAAAAGANNQMSGTAVNALTAGNLVSAGGWDAADDQVRVGATFFSTDYRNNPAVDNFAFTATASAVPGITVSAISGNTAEIGTTATFTVVLNTQPTADVTITLSSDDSSEGTLSTASLTFTDANWDTPQTVTVTGVDDFLDDGNIAYHAVLNAATSADGDYNGINPSDVNITNVDNDTAGFTVSAISGHTTESGGTATFTVVLTAQPTNDVTTGMTSNNTDEGTVSAASLTFTNGDWDTPQTVTVTGVDDVVIDGSVGYTIVLAAATSADSAFNGLNPSDVAVINDDNDSLGGGGGGSSTPDPILPINTSINLGSCSATQVISVTLQGTHVDEYLLSEDPDFVATSWLTFTPDVLGEDIMTVSFTVSSGDGVKTLYAKFRSSTLDQSAVESDTITLDAANACADIPPEEPPVEEEPTTPPEEEPTPVEPPVIPKVSNATMSIATALCSAAPIIPEPTIPVPAVPIVSTPIPVASSETAVPTIPMPEPEEIPAEPELPISPEPETPSTTPKPTTPTTPPTKPSTTSPNPIVDSARIETVLKTFSFPVGVGLATGALTLLATSFNLFTYLWYLFTSPILLFGKKRREAYGLLYNSVTKVPIGLGTVRAFDAENNKLLKTLVSSPEGKFFFSAKPGTYKLQALKNGFSFPSLFLANATDDGLHPNVYHGDMVTVTPENPFVDAHIPLDPTDAPSHHAPIKFKAKKLLRALQYGIGSLGLIASIVALALTPSIAAGILVGLQVIVMALILRLAKAQKPKQLGRVHDAKTGRPLNNVIVRLFEPQYNKLIETAVTNSTGQYWFILGPNEYYLSYSKPGYKEKIVKPVDTRKAKELSVYSPTVDLEAET